MTTSAVGLVVDEHDVGIADLKVVIEDVSQQFDVVLDSQTTNAQGAFALRYVGYKFEPSTPGRQIRKLRLRVRIGQHVVKEIAQDDLPTDDHITFPKIRLTREEAVSWWATLGTGTASRKTSGNAVRWLADNEAGWSRVATVIGNASQRFAADPNHPPALDVMQLTIDCEKFHADQGATKGLLLEDPRVVLQFDPSNPLTVVNKRDLDDKDLRIERTILDTYRAGADVRIQLPKPSLDKHGLVAVATGTAMLGTAAVIFLSGWIAVVAGLLAAIIEIVLAIGYFYLYFSSAPKIVKWFGDAGAQPGRKAVSVKQLHMRSNQFTHAKLVIDRDREALLLGSPMEQDYYDSLRHAIDEPRRGKSAAKGPIHDVSVGVRGPAVGHMQELFNNHWNLAAEDDKLPVAAPALPAIAQSDDTNEFVTTVQFVRTLDAMFTEDFDPPAPTGEQGVLEAYLRAIHFAERFIYIENQYFNNDIITRALIDALAAKPKLVVILFLNSAPDMPFYLKWQQQAIDQIAGSLEDAAAKARLGVFSAWSHAKSNSEHSKPRLVDNYLHTKSAIVDNRWATVGSANLDGASLDSIQYARALFGGDVRNTEGNLVVFEETAPQRSAVDALRRRLWSEHLGIADPASNALDDAQDKNWLDVWRATAQRKLDGLKSNLDQVLAFEGPRTDGIQSHVLPWPKSSKFFDKLGFFERYDPHKVARAHLSALLSPDEQPSDVLLSQFDVLAGGPEDFTFKYKKQP
jgi:phosphatidylserine/phosphatidylglycerophosphate/cardiolipin synthase-like enzyme